MQIDELARLLEGAIMAYGKPLSMQQMENLFEEDARPSKQDFRDALAMVAESCEERGFALVEVASGWRFQVNDDLSPWISRLWEERPQRYSRALLETLALIAYRQPITRGEIEDIRGVAVSSQIIKTLLEREWVKVIGHRDVPGRPAMYATTRHFLDYFSMQSLNQLPSLAEIRDIEKINRELDLADLDPEQAKSVASDQEQTLLSEDEQHQDTNVDMSADDENIENDTPIMRDENDA